MFKLNLKIAWRNLLKYKSYTAINIIGLALGLSGFIFIVLFINHEKSYDTWDKQLDDIYQVQEYSDYFPVEEEFKWKSNIDRRLSMLFAGQLPEVKAVTMIEEATEQGMTISGKTAFLQSGLRRSDSLFFKVMPYHFKYGSSATAFNAPYSMVIKANVAAKYFGHTNPLGKTITMAGVNSRADMAKLYTITGVIEEPKTPSTLDFEGIYVDNGVDFMFDGIRALGNGNMAQIYVKTTGIANVAHFNEVLQKAYLPLKDKHLKQFNSSLAAKLKAGHQPAIQVAKMATVHQYPLEEKSWRDKLAPVILLAVLLLLVSIVNFINLATAQAVGRAKEIGIKKVIGAQKSTLVRQFLTETFLQCLIAMFLGLFLIELLLPLLNDYFSLSLSLLQPGFKLIGQLLLITIVVAFLTGIYPALFLSSYQPKEVLKGNFWNSTKGSFIRKGLVGLQFVITISFIIGILLVTYQVNYLKSRDNGFNKTSLLNLKANLAQPSKKYYNRLKRIEGVKYVGYSSGVIGTNMPSTTSFKFKNETKELAAIGVNIGGLNALDAKVLQGRLFSSNVIEDTVSHVILNESAAKLLGGSVIDQNIVIKDSIQMKVIGVIKDIQVTGFDLVVPPSVYVVQSATTDRRIGTYTMPTTLIRFEPAKLKHIITELEKIFEERNRFSPLKYTLLEDEVAAVLIEHERFEKMVALFSFLSLTLSLFGLFSLAAFITKQRTKEIAIRKVLGAEDAAILVLINKGYTWIILVANAIAFPIAYILGHKWLLSFAYRIDITPLPFILAFVASVGITILTVSLQARKAIKANPVTALKYE